MTASSGQDTATDYFDSNKFYSLLADQEEKKGSTFQRVDNPEDDYFDAITKNLEASKQRTNLSKGQASASSSSDDALTNTGNDNASNFDLNKFESLLGRLEASKGRQQRQKSVEGRRDIFSQGLAGMMSNF